MTREEQILSLEVCVRANVSRLRARLPPWFTTEELTSEAWVGAIQAVDRFDPKLGYKLGTLANRRVLGALLDYLRRTDLASRHERKRLKATGEAGPVTVEIDSRILSVPDNRTPGYTADLDVQKLIHTSGLTKRELQVIMGFLNEQSQAELAKELGIHFSYVSQLQKSAIKKMREAAYALG